jgi:hypothetical protein
MKSDAIVVVVVLVVLAIGLVACDKARDSRYTDPVDLLEPIATSGGLVLVERRRREVWAFSVPDFVLHSQPLGGIPKRVMRRAGTTDSVLVLSDPIGPTSRAVLEVHAPHPPSDQADERTGYCTLEINDASVPRDGAADGGAEDAAVLDPDSGPIDAKSDADVSDGCADSLTLEPDSKGLSVEPHEVQGIWEDWWQSPDGRYVMLTGRDGLVTGRDIALVPLQCPRMKVEPHRSDSTGSVLEDVAFSGPLADDQRLVALRQSVQVNVLEYKRAKLVRELVITRLPSATAPTEFAPREMLFVDDWLVIRERETDVLLTWKWNHSIDDQPGPAASVPSTRFEAAPTAIVGTVCAGIPKLIVAVPTSDGASHLVQMTLGGGPEEEPLKLQMAVKRLVLQRASTGAGVENILIATDLADRDAKLVQLKLCVPFTTQTIRTIKLPQGLRGLAAASGGPESGTLLTYAEEGGGILAPDGSSVRSFGRGIQLEGAVPDSDGRLWVKSDSEPTLRYVDPFAGSLPVTLPLKAKVKHLLPVFSSPGAFGFMVALSASTVGEAAVIPGCTTPGKPLEHRFFLAQALIGATR